MHLCIKNAKQYASLTMYVVCVIECPGPPYHDWMARDGVGKREERKGTVCKNMFSAMCRQIWPLLRNHDSGLPKESKRLISQKSSVSHSRCSQELRVPAPAHSGLASFANPLWSLIPGLLILILFPNCYTDLTSEKISISVS